jgi:hypothetical protein
VQNAAHGRAIAVGLGGPDPLEDLVDGVDLGEDVMCGFPIAVLIRISKASNPERCPVSKRSTEVSRSGAGADRCLESVNDPERIVTEQLLGERNGLGDDEPEVMGEAVRQRCRIGSF